MKFGFHDLAKRAYSEKLAASQQRVFSLSETSLATASKAVCGTCVSKLIVEESSSLSKPLIS
ncbi:hypothetical protein L195_g041699 [Trifolium pratense]|uniref:Uncharacterized protein n=1 Tax=Trifolium pratense TaxID=57577 RepID=A0A2K3M4C4_TRIPR|nr:hypothetical protein L195_g041699 [Trifolium pratense]